jgi:sulfur carrier protein
VTCPLAALRRQVAAERFFSVATDRLVMAISITVNGEPQEVPDGMTVAALLEHLGKNPRFLAVERNLELVPRTEHAVTTLRDADALEIVTLVGGG